MVGGAATVAAAAVLMAIEGDVRRRVVAMLPSLGRRQDASPEEVAIMEALVDPVDPSAEPFDDLSRVVVPVHGHEAARPEEPDDDEDLVGPARRAS